MTPTQPKIRKVSVNLPVEDIETLKSLAEARNTTMTEALRGAIATEKFIRDIYGRDGQLLIKERGRPAQYVILR